MTELQNFIRNSRIFVIASEAKQSLEIRDLFLKILEFYLGILEFLTMSSSGLTRGSLYGILEFPKIRHCEAFKKEGVISFIKPYLLSLIY